MKDLRAKVQFIESMTEKYRRLVLDTEFDQWTPGQFVMVGVPHHAVFTRRPFGIVGIERGALEICFKVVGPGTRALARTLPGDLIDVLGPLGKGFEAVPGSIHVLVAGGYGIAPILGLARMLAAKKERIAVFYGAKAQDHLLYRDELSRLPLTLTMSTEDGSMGEQGVVSDVVRKALSTYDRPVIYACGPEGLMRTMARMGEEQGVPVQVSLDRYMACGMGTCLGCIVEKNDGTQVRACREGPVFDAKTIKWG